MRDRYTITERLDQGGMAEVFRGVAESIQGFKKNVAIKRILPSLTKNQKFVSMFLDEARLSLYLQHANIVQVFDISKTPDNAYFLVMEYVDGCNLKALIERQKQRNKRIEPAHTIYLMIECCKALNYAHFLDNPETNEPLNIVHRDISPPNILLSKNGEVKLVDFGLAKANSQIESTDPGVVKGKFSYLSPEAASGIDVDHRADVFAVGIILWEMFTGRRLFFGDTDYQTVELVRQARVPSIAAINPEIEPELEGVVRKALARDPDDRYQSAADLGDALAQFLFSRRMKVTARDIAGLVRDTQMELMRKRSAEPKESIIDALINDEVAKLTSLVPEHEEGDGEGGAGSQSLDPKEFIDTAGWVSDFGIDVPSSAIPRPDAAKAAPPRKDGGGAARPAKKDTSPRPPGRGVAPPAGHNPEDGLSAMLEPDKTGLHKNTGGNGLLLVILLLLVVGAGVGVGIFLFR
ncbi:MAG: serine/threonine protein kinase [Kofleriaceae bacterium]|nr:serine/threonine protein kinase [Kofleriaceae bacterium]MCB9572081.1 serine/threonine protein kinase [Kofleriaceae bacterium]